MSLGNLRSIGLDFFSPATETQITNLVWLTECFHGANAVPNDEPMTQDRTHTTAFDMDALDNFIEATRRDDPALHDFLVETKIEIIRLREYMEIHGVV